MGLFGRRHEAWRAAWGDSFRESEKIWGALVALGKQYQDKPMDERIKALEYEVEDLNGSRQYLVRAVGDLEQEIAALKKKRGA